MSVFKFLVSVVSELLTIPEIDPYREKWTPPRVTGTRIDPNGYTVLEVDAKNYRDVGKVTEGVTVAGDVSKVATRVGHNKWEIHVEPWHVSNTGQNGAQIAQDKANGQEVTDVSLDA